jgi:hypothetical protein
MWESMSLPFFRNPILYIIIISLGTGLYYGIIKPAKGKKADDEASLYPLYAVNAETMEHTEVPEKFWKISGNPEAEVADSDSAEYIEVLTRYGLDTTIVPKLELDKYLKRLAKKIEKSGLDTDLVTDQLGDDDNI